MVNEKVSTNTESNADRGTTERYVETRSDGSSGGAGLLITLLIIAAIGLGVLYLMNLDSKEAAQAKSLQVTTDIASESEDQSH